MTGGDGTDETGNGVTTADETAERAAGTFLVTHADTDSAVLRDVDGGRVHTLASNPGLETDEIIEGVLVAVPPLEVAWELVETEDRRTVTVTESDESPTRRALETATAQPVGEITVHERAGQGEVHVISVPEDGVSAAIGDVLEDEMTLIRAARLDAGRVEVRSAPGVVSVRYLP